MSLPSFFRHCARFRWFDAFWVPGWVVSGIYFYDRLPALLIIVHIF
jgi:hypothetical protein